MNLERDGAPDIPDGQEECGSCRHFCFIGESGTGFCALDYDDWLEASDAFGEPVTSRRTVRWIIENCIEEGHEPCEQFEEYR